MDGPECCPEMDTDLHTGLTASAEILKWKAVAEESLEAKRVLTARCSELQAQRDESMSINKDLVAGFKHVTAQLSLTQKQVQEQQQRLAAMQAALIAVRAAIEPEGGEGAAPARWGGAAQRQAQAGARTGAAGGDLSEQHMAQLTQLSGQMARDAQRDDERRELLKAQLLGAGAGASSNGNGAAAAAAPVAKSGSNGSGNGNGTAARGAMAAANGKGVPAAAASEAA
ncbi:hypothetical protein MNEG_1882 [Monoraphidium neglectum]|uniref:Uncharacterized protein n=1 Tax=Monoraphidium neglectum TaxID=145388 RepID=A0A0D2K6Z8_9CHLO|nr:hypothetical protein MNEG_1882 [Monoraphidium neglectum]KIZ06073.1 hypothetical protein MNEG_1882 [Monoraphidium neglectum]|eukprot:XP_013905092.1 hypothetical protein MNEG_1882 [Monoraphidium neglectum]